ncbi:exchanger [Penicillium rubens]|uniref:Vacuolar calcium ion transporter n=1 Tax=Penicillium chrysogenum TaxID=5076 RepID=A0A167URU8_PENCH|nr:uncharacterized protein N7525_006519 [Penicillium rubens]KAF3019098.1 exchanger [Penicillium rubens]KAJ5828266.1 hypothetical protein N7525_006519 [Penicillium rubens]KZN89565.1 Vacuolar calcium ion transporter [Penicillium chrysogenum]
MEVNFEGNEQRALLGGDLNSSVPWAEDDRWWVRIPAQHTLYYLEVFRTMLYSFWNDKTLALLICVPFALLADPPTWCAKWTFAFNYISLIALESRFISTAEWIWLFSSPTVSTVLTEALPHVFPLMVGITSIIYEEISLVQSFIIGSLITNLLMGTGLSWLIGGLRFRSQSAPTTSMQSIAALTMLTVFPFIPPTFISPLYKLDPENTALFTLTITETVVMLMIYVMWLWFRYQSHVELFEWENAWDDNSPPGDHRLTGQRALPIPSRLTYIFWLIFILALSIQCSVNLIQTIPKFVQATSMSRLFIGATLLPFTSSLSNFAKTCVIAYDDRMGLVMHLTAETALGVGFFNLPALIIVSICIGHPMLLEFDIFLEVSLFITVFMAAISVQTAVFNYLKGAMNLALYGPPSYPQMT